MHPPHDKRVFYKEAISLAQIGFNVVHIAPGEDGVAHERGAQIVTYRRPTGILGRLIHTPRLYQLAARIDADVYHCNEVDSWFIGVLLKLMRGKKVVFDVHEHYPSTFAESRFPPWLHPLIASVIRLGFRVLTPFTDRLVFAKKSVAIDFSGFEHKQVLVQNFTLLSFGEKERYSQTERTVKYANGPITAIHLGLISRVRGWPQLLEAITLVASERLRVHIVGTFNDGSQAKFEEQVRRLGLNHRVQVGEWMPFEEAYQRLLSADIGLVLLQPGIQNHVYALPHKMFDYMLAGLPVIAPKFAEEVAPIIQEADCGILIDTSNPAEIAEALSRLVNDQKERERLGQNGRRAVIERYNWESEAQKLLQMYLELLGDRR
jgi:glycosyltransferase involved in cell wall biosynthesis